MIEADGTIDSLIKDGPAQQGGTLYVIPVGKHLPSREPLGILGAIWYANCRLLPQRRRGRDQACTKAHSFKRNWTCFRPVLVPLLQSPPNATLHQLEARADALLFVPELSNLGEILRAGGK